MDIYDELDNEMNLGSFKNLYRKVKKTARCRFICSGRLKKHHTYSSWCVALFTFGLVIYILLDVLNIINITNSNYFIFLQIVLAIFILIYSILTRNDERVEKAYRMHEIGNKLIILANKIHPMCNSNFDPTEYNDFVNKYEKILESGSNHSDIDFQLVKLEYPNDYNLTLINKILIKAKYLLQFWHYFVFIVIEIVCILPFII